MKHIPAGARSRSIIPPDRHFPARVALVIVGAAGGGLCAETPEGGDYFERHIRPALVEHCYKCHSEDARKLKGGLRLDTRSGWQKGGDSGPAVVPGEPAESRLLEAIRYRNPDLEMPPDGKLPGEVAAHFEKWIAMGAPDPRRDEPGGIASEKPRAVGLEEGRRFWSFQPIGDPAPPAVKRGDWPRDAIDRFILSKLEDEGLAPSGSAPPEALLRRLSFDLTGLPPSAGDVERFVGEYGRDPAAAVERKVDALLADPAFGERWGRHWLDIVRYSDSTGGGRAIPLPDAWRFRDYVIESFNGDRPLDQLIREHLAGDLLPASGPDEEVRNMVGTGFLVLGPHNYENQDKELLELEIVDEQLDTIGRAFLGMSIGCARCHDHKFDPIPASDYYAMAGIFLSTRSVEHSNVSSWSKQPFPPTAEQAAALESSRKEVSGLEQRIRKLRKKVKETGPARSVPHEALPGIVVDNGKAELTGEWKPSTHTARWVGAAYIHDLNQDKGEKSATFRPVLPERGRYEVRVSYNPSNSRAAKVPVVIRHAGGETATHFNQHVTPEHDGLFHTLGVHEFGSGSDGWVRISNRGTEGFVIVDAVQFLPVADHKAAAEKPAATAKPAPSAEEQALAQLEKQLKKARAAAPKLPTAMAVSEGETPDDTRLRVRGMPRNFGASVPRGFLQAAVPADAPPAAIETGSGRRELAAWITSPEQPLTARVMANRIWLHLLGHGIVRSPDNFGMTGELPSHPELLDHLARRLIDGGWSTKKLVRAIVMSRTYQLDSRRTAHGAAKDPDNRLLSHAHRRSLGAEAIRDTVLLLGGRLDPDHGGPSLPPGFKSEFGYEFTSLKRSVYLPVFRNSLHEVFATFDFANPNFTVGKRSESTIPTQSLFLANSPFIHEHSDSAARQALALEAPDDRERLRLVFLRTLGREPHPGERARSLAFLQETAGPAGTSRREAWAALHRALFSSLDFRYIP